jgi:hypothetical protein
MNVPKHVEVEALHEKDLRQSDDLVQEPFQPPV